MVAKIADLGVARFVPHNAAAMTKAPGASVYMAPEAIASSASDIKKSIYGTSIDIFSFGVISLFTLSEIFPCDLLEPTFVDEESGELKARTELERRGEYMKKIYDKLPKHHLLIQMIGRCLQNIPAKRPGIREVQELLELNGSEMKYDVNKLELIQAIEKLTNVVEILRRDQGWQQSFAIQFDNQTEEYTELLKKLSAAEDALTRERNQSQEPTFIETQPTNQIPDRTTGYDVLQQEDTQENREQQQHLQECLDTKVRENTELQRKLTSVTETLTRERQQSQEQQDILGTRVVDKERENIEVHEQLRHREGELIRAEETLRREQQLNQELRYQVVDLQQWRETREEEAAREQQQNQEQSRKKEQNDETEYSGPKGKSVSIRGVDIVASTTLTLVPGEARTHEWKDHGLRLHFSANSLESDSRPATLSIQVSLSCPNKLPDNMELVSGIYWLSCSCKFIRPVTLELQHCAYLQQSDEPSALCFLTTNCNQKTLPYTFERMEKGPGIFPSESRYGSIELSHFSGVTIADLHNQSKQYTGHIYYIPRSITSWHLHFVVIRDLTIYLRVVEKKYSMAETGPFLDVVFEQDEIVLDINEKGKILESGWTIVPLVCPLSILKKSVDDYIEGRCIPTCQLELHWSRRDPPPDRLIHKVVVTGVKHLTSFTITREPSAGDSTSQVLSNVGKPKTLDIDDLVDVRRPLLPIANKWKEIGIALRLKLALLNSIEGTNSMKNNRENYELDCLSEALAAWLGKSYNVKRFGEPSWQMLVKAVRDEAGGDNTALGIADTIDKTLREC